MASFQYGSIEIGTVIFKTTTSIVVAHLPHYYKSGFYKEIYVECQKLVLAPESHL